MGGTHSQGLAESPQPWQRAWWPMENQPKSPTRLGEDPKFLTAAQVDPRKIISLARNAESPPIFLIFNRNVE
jgi:hypothetical protein